MIRRVLREKNFVPCLLAAITGIVLYLRYPFPEQNFFLELIFLWARPVFQGLRFSYTLFLYTTPDIVYSFVLSGLYIFTLKSPRGPKRASLRCIQPRPIVTICSSCSARSTIRVPRSHRQHHWLTIPERGLFTGIAIFGTVGSGKTSAALYPYGEQILSYEAENPEKCIGGLVQASAVTEPRPYFSNLHPPTRNPITEGCNLAESFRRIHLIHAARRQHAPNQSSRNSGSAQECRCTG
jgi:hypothetical protein